MSAWLAGVDMSTTGHALLELKTLPRPKGAATQVIYTEYDLPRKETQPHDVIVDQDGMVWYSDFSNQFAGVMDPKHRQGYRYSDSGAQAGTAEGQPGNRAGAGSRRMSGWP